ncbi:hypothetical protein [Streptomyces sp. NPDC001970]
MARRRVNRLPAVDGVGMLDGVVNRSELRKVVPAPRRGDRRRDPTQRHREAAARRADGSLRQRRCGDPGGSPRRQRDQGPVPEVVPAIRGGRSAESEPLPCARTLTVRG